MSLVKITVGWRNTCEPLQPDRRLPSGAQERLLMDALREAWELGSISWERKAYQAIALRTIAAMKALQALEAKQ